MVDVDQPTVVELAWQVGAADPELAGLPRSPLPFTPANGGRKPGRSRLVSFICLGCLRLTRPR